MTKKPGQPLLWDENFNALQRLLPILNFGAATILCTSAVLYSRNFVNPPLMAAAFKIVNQEGFHNLLGH